MNIEVENDNKGDSDDEDAGELGSWGAGETVALKEGQEAEETVTEFED